ncbi:MAG: hypothetical protein HGA61_03905 [Candidatus Moranbacteria bacterium]|nr:hypothetical protein [Candidatus Moranbacteria bacterium]
MKNSTKNILAFTMIPLAVLFFSGCSQQTKNAPAAEKTTAQQQAPATQTESQKSPDATSTELPALPSDNKQAIDTELSGIDQALQDTDKALSADKTDSELGL